MTKRFALLGTLTLLLALLPGCPGAVSALVGTWILTTNNTNYGVEILPNGTATPFMVDSILAGTLQWWENDDQFIMNPNAGSIRLIYTGSIQNSSTALGGHRMIWSGSGTSTVSTWSAAKQ